MIISDIKVELIDKMGSDLSVVNAARVSFGKFKNELDDGDKRLIGYLARNGHWTPFGHGTVSFRVKAPIFVARQLVKHQAGLVWNEVSRRYVDSEPEFYFPTSWRARAANVKQGSSDESVTDEGIVDGLMKAECENSLEMYLYLMKEYNVAPEQARMILPLNTMTEWVWTGSLMAWARVCNLRLDPHAQKECRDVAQLINNHMKELFPVSWKALVNDTLSAAAENLA
jgi:thymidylate synthase (FAD)